MKTPDGKAEFIVYCELDKVSIRPDGSLVANYENVGYSYCGWFGDAYTIYPNKKEKSDYYYAGYPSVKKFYDVIITDLKDDYTCTTNVK